MSIAKLQTYVRDVERGLDFLEYALDEMEDDDASVEISLTKRGGYHMSLVTSLQEAITHSNNENGHHSKESRFLTDLITKLQSK